MTKKYTLSKSGRKMFLPKNKLKTANTKVINKWLLDQSIKECKKKRDDYNLLMFEGMNIHNLSPSDIDMMNVYLFDEINPSVEVKE